MGTWIIVLNSNQCQFFSYEPRHSEIQLIQSIDHPENKNKKEALISDKPGHYGTYSGTGGSYEQETDPKDVKINHFLHEVEKIVIQEKNKKRFDKLILIASPKIMSSLLKMIDKQLQDIIVERIQKDVAFLKPHELLDFLKTHQCNK